MSESNRQKTRMLSLTNFAYVACTRAHDAVQRGEIEEIEVPNEHAVRIICILEMLDPDNLEITRLRGSETGKSKIQIEWKVQ